MREVIPEWSFSRASCYDNCPKCYELCYVRKVDKRDNAFAEWGSLIHSCLEKYFNGELELYELSDYYNDSYSEFVDCEFPYNAYSNLGENYKASGEEYLDNFDGVDEELYDIIGVEQEFHITVEDIPFQGYIDLILRDKKDGEIIIIDHKSASSLKGKKLAEYTRQLYLYSEYIYQEYNQYPKLLVFNQFRAGTHTAIEFNKEDFDSAVLWLKNIVDSATSDESFPDKISVDFAYAHKDISDFKRNDFYCNNLCSARAHCDRSSEYEGGDADWL